MVSKAGTQCCVSGWTTPCPRAHHGLKHQASQGHVLHPRPVPGWPCPETPQEMAAALRVHVLQWEISPWPPFWRLLSSQGSDGQQVQMGLGRGGSSRVQPSLRARVPQHHHCFTPAGGRLCCWGRRGLLAPNPRALADELCRLCSRSRTAPSLPTRSSCTPATFPFIPERGQ